MLSPGFAGWGGRSWILSRSSAQGSLQDLGEVTLISGGTFPRFSSEPSAEDTMMCSEVGKAVCVYGYACMCVYMCTQRTSNVVIIVIDLAAELAFLCTVTESIPSVTDVVMHFNKQA